MSAPTIEKIDVFPVVYPTIGRFKFFEGPKGRPEGRASVLVKLTASDGTVGWGQSVPVPRWSYETLETVFSTTTRYLAPELLGLDPFDTAAIHEMMTRTIAPSFSIGQPICKAGIDLALFDLTGRIQKKTARARWGRTGRNKLKLSWTLNPRTPDELEASIAQARARGYSDFNVKIAPDVAADLELCRRIKRLAPDSYVWADANGGYDEASALAVIPKLADLGVSVIEQPLAANRLSGYRRLKQQGALPILMDEGIVSSIELREFIELALLDGVAIKPPRCGGLTEARRQIEILQENGLLFFGSGLTDPDCSLAASLLLFAAYDLEYAAALNGPQFIEATVLTDALVATHGELSVPTGFGLGVEIDESKIDSLLVEV